MKIMANVVLIQLFILYSQLKGPACESNVNNVHFQSI